MPPLGGFHAAMRILRVIGQNMQDYGLSDVWIKSDIPGANAAELIEKQSIPLPNKLSFLSLPIT